MDIPRDRDSPDATSMDKLRDACLLGKPRDKLRDG